MDEALWSSVLGLLSGDNKGLANRPHPHNTAFLDYAAYFDLALVPPALDEVSAEDRDRAERHLRHRLTNTGDGAQSVGPPRIANFSTDDFEQSQLDRMGRWWDVDPKVRMGMIAATGEQRDAAESNIAIALSHLKIAAPELHGEFEAFIGDIVLSRPGPTSRETYSGASSLALWGAFTINPESQSTWPQMYRHLVHEEGHNALFAIAGERALVADDPQDRHISPIRPDPRPMDGIFHAAFVSAREALALDALLAKHEAAPRLSDTEAEVIEAMLKTSVLAFVDCAELLREAGQLTEFGTAVLTDCEAFMTENFMVD